MPSTGRSDRPAARPREELVGFLAILVAAVAFGATPTAAKLGFDAGGEPGTLVAGRALVAAGCLWALAAVRGEARLRGRAALLLAAGLIPFAGQALLLFSALERSPASTVTLLVYSYPAMVAGLARLIGRERLDRPKVLGLVLGMAGVALVLAAPRTGISAAGVALSLGSALAFSIYVVAADRLATGLPALAVGATVNGAAAASLAAWAAATGGLDLTISGEAWAWLLALGVLQAVSMGAYLAAIARIGPTRTAIGDTFQPVVSVTLAAVLLGERLAPVQLAGGLLVVGAVLVLVRSAWIPAEAEAIGH